MEFKNRIIMIGYGVSLHELRARNYELQIGRTAAR
jgi:hypothetical protein